MDYWLQRKRDEDFKMLGRLLGNFWDEDSIEEFFREPDPRSMRQRQREFFYPFSFIVNADFMEGLKKSVGRKYGIAPPTWAKDDSSFTDMFEWEPEDFLQFVSGVVDPHAPRSR